MNEDERYVLRGMKDEELAKKARKLFYDLRDTIEELARRDFKYVVDDRQVYIGSKIEFTKTIIEKL